MSFFQSIFRHFSPSSSSSSQEEKVQVIVGEDVDDLWPRIVLSPCEEEGKVKESSLAARRGVIGLAAARKESERRDASLGDVQEEASTTTTITDPIALPALERDSNTLMHDFMQKFVEVAVGREIKEQALKHAQEKLDAAVRYHDLLRRDYFSLCRAVARVSALRPWLRSEKYLAETRIALDATRGPVREEEFWVPGKMDFDDDDESLEEKLGPFPMGEVVTRWDEASWSVRSFKLLSRGGDAEDDDDDAFSWGDSSSEEVSEDDELATTPRRETSISSLKSFLRDDLAAISNDDDEDDDEDDVPKHTKNVHRTPPWPSTNLTKKDRKQIRRLCERHIDPRRPSIQMEERTAMKQRLREKEDLLSHLRESIHFVHSNHPNLSSQTDATQIKLCKKLLHTITEIEIAWELHKELSSPERSRAQILVLKLQWELHGSSSSPQNLRKKLEGKLGGQRQRQMDVWQDIVCAAALRGTPEVERTNIFGEVGWGSSSSSSPFSPSVREDQGDEEELMLLLRGNVGRGGPPERAFEPVGSDAEHFGLVQEGHVSGIVEGERSNAGLGVEREDHRPRNKSDVEELRTTRLDSGFE